MKIECIKEQLEEALNKADKIAGKNTTLPVLSGFYLDAHQNSLTIKATNLDLGISVKLPVKVVEPGTVVVPAHIVSSFISSLSKDRNITLSTKGQIVEIKTSSTKTSLKTLPSEEFPIIPEIGDDNTFSLPARDFVFGIRSVIYAAAVGSIKPELSSISITHEGDNLVFAATDSFRLAEKKIRVKKIPHFKQILIPQKNALEIIKIFDKGDEELSLSIEEHQLALRSGNVYLTSRIIEGVFKPRENTASIKAPHFVFFVIDELVKKYGEDAVRNSGWKVVTTLDYSIQQDAEALAKRYGEINERTFNANNNAIVVMDPKNGEILAMVGSRDYFDQAIDGNFNAALGHRQPGSTFKPFVYSVLFNKGYTDSTVLFDAQIQFSPTCAADFFVTDDKCYSPGNYDDKFRGPMTIRNALAQSINIPAVEAVYLAGVQNSINLAEKMGIKSLTELDRYGLSIVLGGGAVSLLDMTSAYAVFADDGIKNAYNPILWLEDGNGNIIERQSPYPERVLPENTARIISSILSDNVARTPGYGPNSPLYIASRDVAVKTGTSNDYRDAWIIGYAPNIVVGAWVGNNDNSPMEKKVAGLIVSPLWRDLMDKILPNIPIESFVPPKVEDPADLKPILRGEIGTEAHSILYYVDKDNPRGPIPSNPNSDPQFANWEYGVKIWSLNNRGVINPQIGG